MNLPANLQPNNDAIKLLPVINWQYLPNHNNRLFRSANTLYHSCGNSNGVRKKEPMLPRPFRSPFYPYFRVIALIIASYL